MKRKEFLIMLGAAIAAPEVFAKQLFKEKSL